jgi:hypothetical protein
MAPARWIGSSRADPQFLLGLAGFSKLKTLLHKGTRSHDVAFA